MIRFTFLFTLLATSAVAQTDLSERPGLWIAVPRAGTPTVVLEAPEAGPVITTERAPSTILSAPESTVLILAPSLVPTARVPETRPVPRPFSEGDVEVAASEDPNTVDQPVVADAPAPLPVLETARASEPTLPPSLELEPTVDTPLAETEVIAGPSAGAADPALSVEDPSSAISELEVAALPIEIPTVRPTPRPQVEQTAALAADLAERLAAEAQAIATSAPREAALIEVPVSQDTFVVPDEAVALQPVVQVPDPVQPSVQAPTEAPVNREPVQTLFARAEVPPSAVPVLPVVLAEVQTSMGAGSAPSVLLPSSARSARPTGQPVAAFVPPRDIAPILPRISPSGPQVLNSVVVLAPARPELLSAALLPSIATPIVPLAPIIRARAPAYDPFPMSALPPSALQAGPDSLERTIQPPVPFAEANAAILLGPAFVVPARLPAAAPLIAPSRDTPIADPEAEAELPAPDANALARMMEDAAICWELADLSVEAQWARLSVDVALDETNMPSAQSIRLTGFAHVVSGAAESAFRAAHGALTGCAEATPQAPITASATLIFDRNGIRLR